MTTSNDKATLRPCPSCGGTEISVVSFNQNGKGTYEETHGPQCKYCTLDSASINEWNNMFCWKEIDSLKEKISEALSERDSNKIQSNNWAEAATVANERLRSLEIEIENLRKYIHECDKLSRPEGWPDCGCHPQGHTRECLVKKQREALTQESGSEDKNEF